MNVEEVRRASGNHFDGYYASSQDGWRAYRIELTSRIDRKNVRSVARAGQLGAAPTQTGRANARARRAQLTQVSARAQTLHVSVGGIRR